ncbi:MAG: deoxyribodipyrimidine photolyase [Acidobacteria bacterium]|nr:deoxyribodipyrimidine photolyase [Acidobacteriota bacterium]
MLSAYEGFRGGAPPLRVRAANDRGVNSGGSFVLYWMIANRRARYNFSLNRATAWARELGRPLVVLEALRVDYPYASERLHRFVIDGMADNQRAFADGPVLYYPYVEPYVGAGRGLLERLSADASVIVTDDYPCFFLPQAVRAAADRVAVRLEVVDSNGLLPLAAVPQAYPAAVHHRRFMQGALRSHLSDWPSPAPDLSSLPGRLKALPLDVTTRWPAATQELLSGSPVALEALPIDHVVRPVGMRGGSRSAEVALGAFVNERLSSYDQRHNHPDDRGTSRLSPYLHFGHIAAHHVFDAVMKHEQWTVGRLGGRPSGAREGWWGVSNPAEAFLDQLVVWRELGFSTCAKRPHDYDRFEGLPEWAQQTLLRHADDPRPFVYDRAAFEAGATHDPLWNAAQREMVRDGWMHNYMRMLWGKKILEWSASPVEALDTMTALMNRWSLDGRDPNSYAGYMWVLGRYDRPWPERPIYGTVRSMSSESAMRKIRVARYLAESRHSGLFDR